ncbi:MAG: radical SAM protein [Bacillota bacterium]|nr:radical SAM protein [Bacillota bacterium]
MKGSNTIGGYSDILIGPHSIAFDITNKCNLRCLHCYNSSGENIVVNNELTDQEVLNFIDDISKFKLYRFSFCGGETMLRKELLIECTKRLKAKGTHIVSMVSNGILIAQETAKELKEAGIDSIKISIDGSSSCTHDKLRNQTGSFEKTISGIKNLLEAGFNPNFAFTPTSFNSHEIKEVHKLLIALGVRKGTLGTQPLMFLGRAYRNLEEIKASNLQYRKLIKDIAEINSTDTTLKVTWGDPIEHLIRFRTISKHCVDHCTIQANGNIVISPYLPLVIGNIRKYSIYEYWNSGLPGVWNFNIPKEMAKSVLSISDMNKESNNMPKVFEEESLYIDLIDDDLNDMDCIEKNLNVI